MTENRTPELALRIRLLAIPESGEIDEFHLEHYHVGQVYTVPSRLASLLILAGYAEPVESHSSRAEAADFGRRGFPKTK